MTLMAEMALYVKMTKEKNMIIALIERARGFESRYEPTNSQYLKNNY